MGHGHHTGRTLVARRNFSISVLVCALWLLLTGPALAQTHTVSWTEAGANFPNSVTATVDGNAIASGAAVAEGAVVQFQMAMRNGATYESLPSGCGITHVAGDAWQSAAITADCTVSFNTRSISITPDLGDNVFAIVNAPFTQQFHVTGTYAFSQWTWSINGSGFMHAQVSQAGVFEGVPTSLGWRYPGVRVTNELGHARNNVLNVSVTPPPHLTELSPQQWQPTGGETITLTGEGLVHLSELVLESESGTTQTVFPNHGIIPDPTRTSFSAPSLSSGHWTLSAAGDTLNFTVLSDFTLAPPTGTLFTGHVGQFFASPQITWAGAVAPVTTTLTGDLPADIVFDAATQTFRGTPSAVQPEQPVTLTVTDAVNVSRQAEYRFVINDAPQLNAVSPSQWQNTGGETVTITGTGLDIVTGLVLTVTSTGPDAGTSVSIPDTGFVSQSSGAITFTTPSLSPHVGVITAVEATGGLTYTVLPDLALTPPPGSALPGGAVDEPYAGATITLANMLGTAAYTLTLGELPPGLDINAATGAITGTPTAHGDYDFTITATDSITGQAIDGQYTITIAPVPAGPSAAEVMALQREFLRTRMAFVSAAITPPGLRDRFTRSRVPLSAALNGAGDQVAFGFASSLGQARSAAGRAIEGAVFEEQNLPYNVWVDAQFAIDLSNAAGDHFSLVALGADYLVDNTLLIGVTLAGDWATMTGNTGTMRGSGFLMGPYLSTEIAEDLVLDANLLWGRSFNSAQFGAFGGEFMTDRLLANLRLEGALNHGGLTIRPNAVFGLAHEFAHPYAISDGTVTTPIPGFEETTLRYGAGASLSYDHDLGGGLQLTPELSARIGGLGTAVTPLFDGVYGGIGAGLTLSGDSWSLSGTIDADADTRGITMLRARAGLSAAF